MRKSGFAVLGALLLLTVLYGLFWFQMWEGHGIPRHRQIGMCDGKVARIGLRLPRGSRHALLLTHPSHNDLVRLERHSLPLKITVRSGGRVVAERRVDGVQGANWLADAGFPSSMLLGRLANDGVRKLPTEQDYEVEVRFAKAPPSGTSAWLAWTTNP